jgi:hypothetical protein
MARDTTRTRFLLALGLGLHLAVLAGCHSGSLPPQASPERARTALTRALDAWQKGESLDALAQRDPAVYFNDPKCRSDVQLLTYKMGDAHEFYGQSVRIPVVLSFKLPNGTTKERKTTYLIDTSPAIVIVPG